MRSIHSRRHQRGSTLTLFTLMLTTVLIPLVGLAIDGTMLFIVQGKLSAACDAAALGAGRLLGTSANTQEIAGEFLKANFPTSYWHSFDFRQDIQVTTVFSLHKIVVNATVQVPLLFMRVMRFTNSTVAATATATRKDTRVEMVLDRSYSMKDNMSDMKTSAAGFASMFNPGSDQLGLVVYSGGAFVAYPATVQPSTTGPNGHFADPVSGGADNMITMISSLKVGADTSTAEGLWIAYQEMLKSFSLDSDPTRLNAIVLFTDGVPNGFTAFFNDASNGGAKNTLNATSACKYNPATAGDSSTNLYGFMCTRGGSGSGLAYFNPTTSDGYGIYQMLQFNTSQTAKYWATHTTNNGGSTYVNDEPSLSGTKPYKGTTSGDCVHLTGSDVSGLKKIPASDYYGNATTGAADTYSALYHQYGIGYDSTKPTNGYHVGLASWNAVDNAAKRILADTQLNIAIYCIGYTGNGGVDAGLMKRIANTLDSTARNANYQTGIYVEADDALSLANAFNNVASSILRLAQ